MEIKAIVLDLDGTLLNSERKISKETKEALIRAQKMGIKVMIASGRSANGLRPFAEELELHKYGGLLISNNGAVVEDPFGEVMHLNNTIHIPAMQKLIQHVSRYDAVMGLMDHNNIYALNGVNSVIDTGDEGLLNVVEGESIDCGLEIIELDHFDDFDKPISKFLVASHLDYMDEHREAIIAPVKDEISFEYTTPYFIEFMRKGTNKANGLEAALKVLNIPRAHSIAFGDGENDLSLIQYAGTGVAMGNATPNIKRHADFLTHSNDENGISTFLEDKLFTKILK